MTDPPIDTVGFTTSLPVEVILAAGLKPLDLNNAFIDGPDPEADVALAERSGFPRNMCAWIKGIYGTVKRLGISRVLGVLSGDCSYTEALLDVLRDDGVEVTGFHFPVEPDPVLVRRSIEQLAEAFGVTEDDAQAVWQRLSPTRTILAQLDRMTWHDATVSGAENFRFLINSSDFQTDPDRFHAALDTLLEQASRRQPASYRFRLGLIGIPPAFSDLHSFLEARSAGVLYNEMPREFAMIEPAPDIYLQYCRYTYPFPFQYRLSRIQREISTRSLDGVIHYVQSFCYRSVHDRLLRRHLDVPLLTIEGDSPGPVTSREAVRLEGFLEMLEERTA